MSLPNKSNLLADLENSCTAFFLLKKAGLISEQKYQEINGQIYRMEELAQEVLSDE